MVASQWITSRLIKSNVLSWCRVGTNNIANVISPQIQSSSNCDPFVLESPKKLDKKWWNFLEILFSRLGAMLWNQCITVTLHIQITPVESLIWPNSHGSCSSLAKSNVCYNGAYINFLILFLSINFRGHKYTIVGGNPFCQLLKAMLSFMWSIYME